MKCRTARQYSGEVRALLMLLRAKVKRLRERMWVERMVRVVLRGEGDWRVVREEGGGVRVWGVERGVADVERERERRRRDMVER